MEAVCGLVFRSSDLAETVSWAWFFWIFSFLRLWVFFFFCLCLRCHVCSLIEISFIMVEKCSPSCRDFFSSAILQKATGEKLEAMMTSLNVSRSFINDSNCWGLLLLFILFIFSYPLPVKPLTVEEHNIDHLATVQSSSGKLGYWHSCACVFVTGQKDYSL